MVESESLGKKSDDPALHRQLGFFDFGIVEGYLEALLQIEGLGG